MKFTLNGAQTIVSLNLEEAREMAKYDHRTSEYWPTLIGERLWFLNMLNNIKAEPVKHGHWISVPHKKDRICSRCECDEPYKFADEYADVFNYCPHCGARMDGKNNE